MKKNASFSAAIQLLADLVVFKTYDFDQFLKKLIKLITQIVPTDSCLIYFYDRTHKEFILVGSKKSHKNLLGKLNMKKGEGITGWVADHQKTVNLEKEAYNDKRFKHFEELPEDRFEAFLSVPITDHQGVVGILNLQNRQPYKFKREEVNLIEGIVKIIASAFEKIALERKVDQLETKLEERKSVEKAKGLLMKIKGFSESEAYRMLQQEAMKKRKTIKEIADAVILVWS